MNQAGAGDAGEQFHIAVKGARHGHQLGLLVLQHMSDCSEIYEKTQKNL
jgi:hypothetical protein